MEYIEIFILVLLVMTGLERVAAIMSGHLSSEAYGKINKKTDRVVLIMSAGAVISALMPVFFINP